MQYLWTSVEFDHVHVVSERTDTELTVIESLQIWSSKVLFGKIKDFLTAQSFEITTSSHHITLDFCHLY